MIYIYPHWIESTQKSNPIDNSALTLDLQTETSVKLETTNVTPILQRARTLKDLTSVSACRVFPKVDMNTNVQVNIQPSTSRYQLKWIL